MVQTFELLDYLAFKCGCMYLSDLPAKCWQIPLFHALRKVTPEAFPVREWNDAVAYLTGEERNFQSQELAAGYLLSYFSDN
jgi:hypothetical protein